MPNTMKSILVNTTFSAADSGYLSDWLDVSEYNELISWLDVTFTSRVNETIDCTIQRQADNAVGYVTIETFDQKTATGSEEETTTSLIGGKVRAKVVAAGTFGVGTTAAVTVKVQGKKV